MFEAAIKRIDDRQARCRVLISTDTLSEAERTLSGYLSLYYGNVPVVLRYTDGLNYIIYIDGIYYGSVEIVLTD